MIGLASHWSWMIGGIVLLALETIAPGIFLFWVGLAALATGLLLWILPLSFTAQLLLFAILGFVAILIGRRVQGQQKDEVTDAPHLNERGKALVGRVFILETAIDNGVGSVKIDDSVWRVIGDDLPAGDKIRVTGIEGSTLVVIAA